MLFSGKTMSDIAIRIDGISKQYHISGPQRDFDRLSDWVFEATLAPFNRAKDLIFGRAKSASDLSESFWALKDISFEIKKGEVMGIIGRNGAGKSTLLKILSRITEPTEGSADIYGRVGSLLEVGTGFHPELTGRENIYLNGAILGMNKNEIKKKLDDIVEFAEIGQFIDTPVKHYSSGMYVRLAFSISAHLEPEILLVDEVLAVGDVAFQQKCLGKMDGVAQEGRTVLFVSHNMGLMQTLCKSGILLQEGVIQASGTIEETVDTYLRTLEKVKTQDLATRTDRKGKGKTRLIGVEVINDSKSVSTILKTGEPARFIFHISNKVPYSYCNFSIINHIGQLVTSFKSKHRAPNDRYSSENGLQFICEVDELLLMPGRYRMDVSIVGDNHLQDFIEAATVFDVGEGCIAGRPLESDQRFSMIMPYRWILPKD
jgi:lipopolysaccharide transport system ATP-binding protein